MVVIPPYPSSIRELKRWANVGLRLVQPSSSTRLFQPGLDALPNTSELRRLLNERRVQPWRAGTLSLSPGSADPAPGEERRGPRQNQRLAPLLPQRCSAVRGGYYCYYFLDTQENRGSLLLVVMQVPMMLIEGPGSVQFQRSIQNSTGAITRYSSSGRSFGRGSRMWDSPFLSEFLCCSIAVRPAPEMVVSVVFGAFLPCR